MPLTTQILRDGEHLPRSGNGWVVGAMLIAASIDSGEGPFAENTLMGVEGREMPEEWHSPETCNNLKQNELNQFLCDGCGKAFPIVIGIAWCNTQVHYGTLAATPLNNGKYTVKGGPYVFVDQSDGEVFTIQPGDVLVAQRVSR